MPESKCYLSPEGSEVKHTPFLAHFVDLRLSNCLRRFDITLEHKGKETLPAGEYGVIHHRQPFEEEKLTRKASEKYEVQLSEYKHYVLVEVRAYHLADPYITVPPMVKQQILQMPKLTNCIVTTSNCLCPFSPPNSYANVCLHDHRYIICAISHT